MIELKDWDDLEKLPPSKTHYINVVRDEKDSDLDTYWISPFNTVKDSEYYLSSHTFYVEHTHKYTNEILKKCGFDAKIVVEES